MAETAQENVQATQVIDDETTQKLGEASLSRIKQIARMAKEYYRAISGNLTSNDFYLLGMDTMLAGVALIERSMTMDNLDVDERIGLMNSSITVFLNVLNKVYLNPEVVANQVAKASLETAQRSGKFNSDLIEKNFGGSK